MSADTVIPDCGGLGLLGFLRTFPLGGVFQKFGFEKGSPGPRRPAARTMLTRSAAEKECTRAACFARSLFAYAALFRA